jgi:DNA-binding NarL/FixJ family response regulator
MMRSAPNGCILPTVEDVSVLVVDDHAVFAEAVQAWLAREADLRPIWTAAAAAEACALIDRYRPTVVVLDLVLADGSGLDVLDHARTRSPETRTLMLSAATSTDEVIAALRHGARGWLPKTTTADHLVEVIRRVVRGEAWLAPDLLGRVLTDLVAQPAAPPPDPLASLTMREHEVLQCLVDGLGRAEIAARLHVSANTVRTHTQNLLAKLGVHSTLESVALALRYGLRSSDS